MKNTLITRDSKGKIRVVNICCTWNESSQSYIIEKNTGLYLGKTISQPQIEISVGKAKRTVSEQAELEYKSNLKKYLDKGYIDITDFGYDNIDDFDPNEVMPNEIVDQSGARKPQLAKKQEDIRDRELFNNDYYASTKLDGVRMMLRYEDGILKTSSRGGGNYDIPSTYILQDEALIAFMKENSNLILDGELYIHGKSLPYISGLCRKITLEESHKELKYYIYDVAGNDLVFKDRIKLLDNIRTRFNNDKFFVCRHVLTKSWEDIKHLHDNWVSQGFEGCVIRASDGKYGYGKKDNRMIKVKNFSDAEFEIIGLNEGLRDEDFSFKMKCENGEFGAKPIGDRKLRQYYRDNIKNLIGKQGTIKHFGFTPDGIPNLPIFKAVRYEEDLD